MSLFKTREWWAASISTTEEFDIGCMAIGNVDNALDSRDKIVVGSFEGILRIWLPHQRDFEVSDLLLEQDLGQPILELAIGFFLPDSDFLALAVLHPRQLSVYSISSSAATVTHTSSFNDLKNLAAGQCRPVKIYEHSLARNAFCMCFGPFGGVFGKDYICVQSTDGVVMFFEQDNAAFVRQLDDFLLPGPICYVSKTDSFVTYNSQMQVVCIKYHTFASNLGSHETYGKKSGEQKQKLEPSWVVNLGERALDIRVARVSRNLGPSQVDILVLGEHTLFCLKENGNVRLQMRVDYNPVCCYPYVVSEDDVGNVTQNLIIASDTGFLMVYEDNRLVWSARASDVPVQIGVAEFCDLRGQVVTLSESGKVSCSYMGTDPTVNMVPSIEMGEKDKTFATMERERRQLQALISKHDRTKGSGGDKQEEQLNIRAQVPSAIDASFSSSQDPVVTVRLFVSYTGPERLEDIPLHVSVSDPIYMKQQTLVIPTLAGGFRSTPIAMTVQFACKKGRIPVSLNVGVVCHYPLSNSGGGRKMHVATCTIKLPFSLVANVTRPSRTATYKLTVDTNRDAAALDKLFADIIPAQQASSDVAPNVISIQLRSGHVGTVVVSKSGGRYRVQGGHFASLAIVLDELVTRLREHFGSESALDNATFEISNSQGIPLNHVFAVLDRHFDKREVLRDLNKELDGTAGEMRAIQKRLLVRTRERNPPPLNEMDVLLQVTNERMAELAQRTQMAQNELLDAQNDLVCAMTIFTTLIYVTFQLDEFNVRVIGDHLFQHVFDSDEMGYEEFLDAGVIQLLKTQLSKSHREAAGASHHVQELAMPSDTARLKKHLTLVCERLAAGIRARPSEKKSSSAVKGATS